MYRMPYCIYTALFLYLSLISISHAWPTVSKMGCFRRAGTIATLYRGTPYPRDQSQILYTARHRGDTLGHFRATKSTLNRSMLKAYCMSADRCMQVAPRGVLFRCFGCSCVAHRVTVVTTMAYVQSGFAYGFREATVDVLGTSKQSQARSTPAGKARIHRRVKPPRRHMHQPARSQSTRRSMPPKK